MEAGTVEVGAVEAGAVEAGAVEAGSALQFSVRVESCGPLHNAVDKGDWGVRWLSS